MWTHLTDRQRADVLARLDTATAVYRQAGPDDADQAAGAAEVPGDGRVAVAGGHWYVLPGVVDLVDLYFVGPGGNPEPAILTQADLDDTTRYRRVDIEADL